MHIKKKQAVLAVLDAVDNLSLLAELHARLEKENAPAEFAEEQSDEQITKRAWQDPKNFSLNIEKIKTTFKTLYLYLKDTYDNNEPAFREAEMQKGIQAMMNLVMEAGQNLDRYLLQFPEGKLMEKVTEWPEYKDLQQLYLNVIAPKIQTRLEMVEAWQEEWGVGVEEPGAFTKKRGIGDIEGVRHDRDYELFLIRNEEGRPYFSRVLLRHMQLVEQFDAIIAIPSEEDPLSKTALIQDRDLHLVAREILHIASAYIDDFYRMGMKFKEMPLIAAMNKVLMALMLTANPRNLKQTALEKCCTDYFSDFHHFLRTLITSKEFQQFFIQSPPASERIAHCVINLCSSLCVSFFMREASVEDMRPLIRQLIDVGKKGEEIAAETKSPLSLWNTLLDEDELIRSALKYSTYGPLKNAMAVFNQSIPRKGFDPIVQGNLPYYLYSAVNEQLDVGFLRLPCPTIQTQINKAEIIPEFDVFLRALTSGKRNQRHLLFNLQDRTSWQEYTRCTLLEEIQKKGAFEQAINVITLARATPFYFQSESYRHLEEAHLFKQQLKSQVEGGEQCGFSFPEGMDSVLKAFVPQAMETIHEIFFAGKKELTHKNRLDFIEIFYLLLILKCIEHFNPDTVSFTSKDAIDGGAALNAEMFAFLRMMNGKEAWTEEEKDRLRWLFYVPALLYRQRAIESQPFRRSLSALSVINAELEAHYSHVIQACRPLFKMPFFTNLRIQWEK